MSRIRKHIVCAVSGGRSSAVSAILVNKFRKKYKYRSRHFVFANTGMEHPKTIEFLKHLEAYLDQKIIKLEFDFDDAGYKYNVIENWSDLSMDGTPFRRTIQFENRNLNRGLPHVAQPYCSSRMKKNIIRKWSKDTLKTVKYAQCIGYRKEDMPKRISLAEMNELGNAYIFPLLTHYKNPCGLKWLDAYWGKMPFKLEIPSFLGNCMLCWKKSDKNLVDVLKSGEANNFVSWWHDNELRYNSSSFRGIRSVNDMVTLSISSSVADASNGDSCTCSF
jgi:hypothetical protein